MTHVANGPGILVPLPEPNEWREAWRGRTFMDHDGYRTVLEQAHPEEPA